MENLSYLLTLTKDEESFLNRIVKERKRKRLLDRVNQLGFYIREMQKEQLRLLRDLDRISLRA